MKPIYLLACLAAGPALANCPTAADLDGGVRVTEDDGTINLFTRQADGFVRNDGTATFGYTYRNILAQGTHLIELGDTENGEYIAGTIRTVEFPGGNAALPVPSPNTSVEYETTVDTGTSVYPETQTQVWGAQTTLQIGDCTYDMIPGDLTYVNDSFTVFEGIYYLPEVGLGLLHTYQIEGEAPSRYTASLIEAVAARDPEETAGTCPTAADLTRGVEVLQADGSIDTYRMLDDTTIQLVGDYGDGYGFVQTLVHGALFSGLMDVENGVPVPGTETAVSFEVPLADLPQPEANSTVQIPTTLSIMGDPQPELQTHNWGAPTTYTLGGCDYTALPMKSAFTGDFEPLYETTMYLTELGIGLVLSYRFGDEEPGFYTYTAIRALD
ncbi:MAG: hypothetical protein AAGL89_05510 [Pseudomonadota bacterium]